ncbi:MAG TPA: hypothetical protein VNH44_15150 [Micropepsaceae bacterium]|nr:hypothetical protein [Micropepsaceae bacterium]
MVYLDVNPMITALRTSPETFEFTNDSLYHIPSCHSFRFGRDGRVRLDAHCDCAFLAVSEDQEPALYEAYNDWRVNYWRPVEINRQFAAHFDPPSGWRRLLLALTERLHRALLRQHATRPSRAAVAVPAE